jgi:hypothetical protein
MEKSSKPFDSSIKTPTSVILVGEFTVTKTTDIEYAEREVAALTALQSVSNIPKILSFENGELVLTKFNKFLYGNLDLHDISIFTKQLAKVYQFINKRFLQIFMQEVGFIWIFRCLIL